MIAIVGESGCGKTATANHLMLKCGYKRTITYTTRFPRIGEVDGVDYHFLTKEEFLTKQKENFFAETSVNEKGDYYGTAREDCTNDRIIVVNPQGLRALRKCSGIDITAFYICVPRRDRIIKALQRGDDIDTVYQRSLSDMGEYKGITDDVDFIINNEDYRYDVNTVANIIMSSMT